MYLVLLRIKTKRAIIFPLNGLTLRKQVLHLTLLDKSKYRNMSYLGQKIRETREKQNLLLRQVAAHIEVDTALMSKAERGERNLNRDQ